MLKPFSASMPAAQPASAQPVKGTTTPQAMMRKAIALSKEGMRGGHGGPFGAVIAKDGKIIGYGFNQVLSSHDPTAHAEVVAIRMAAKNLSTFDLKGSKIYSSCEPCPMCLGAIYWANIDELNYGNSRNDAANIGFRDQFLYDELKRPLSKRVKPTRQFMAREAKGAFTEWQAKPDKTAY